MYIFHYIYLNIIYSKVIKIIPFKKNSFIKSSFLFIYKRY